MLEIKRPVDEKFNIISPFGGQPRTLVIDGKVELQTAPHQGIDFGCPLSTIVKGVASGRVLKAGYQDPSNQKIGLGLRVMQQFEFEGEQYICCYGHLSEIFAEEGEFLEVGRPVGLSGQSGHAEGPHLHVQFRKLDTNNWIDARFV